MPRILFAIVCGVLCGVVHFIEWLPILRVRNAPIVTGVVVARRPIHRLGGIPGVDFIIRLESGAKVHARAQRYLMRKVPERVRFRYSGDPAREVFLFEHEENPLWIFLCCWGVSLSLIWYLRGTVSPGGVRVRGVLAAAPAHGRAIEPQDGRADAGGDELT